MGCGPQEEFYGCADVAIEGNDVEPQPTMPRPTQPPVTQQRITQPPVVVTQAPVVFTKPPAVATQPPAQGGGLPFGFFPLGVKSQTTQGHAQTQSKVADF